MLFAAPKQKSEMYHTPAGFSTPRRQVRLTCQAGETMS